MAAVAIEGFQELGLALEGARKRVRRGSGVALVGAAYLEFAVLHPALYEVMFSLKVAVPFGMSGTPAEMRFAFFATAGGLSRAGREGGGGGRVVLGEFAWGGGADADGSIAAGAAEGADAGAGGTV